MITYVCIICGAGEGERHRRAACLQNSVVSQIKAAYDSRSDAKCPKCGTPMGLSPFIGQHWCASCSNLYPFPERAQVDPPKAEVEGKKNPCLYEYLHVWEKYEGFTEVYHYCVKCDTKRC